MLIKLAKTFTNHYFELIMMTPNLSLTVKSCCHLKSLGVVTLFYIDNYNFKLHL